MPQCYHCKQWVDAGKSHDCWTTTEAALTRELALDLREAWERLRETAVEYGNQRIYASHNSIMFSRRSCYFFVRPKRTFLEVCIFLGRPLTVPAVRRVTPASKTKFAHLIRVTHRDEVEAPITDWLQEAYEFAGDTVSPPPPPKPVRQVAAVKPAAQATTKARRATNASARVARTKTARTSARTRVGNKPRRR
jgi:hypothetical protein